MKAFLVYIYLDCKIAGNLIILQRSGLTIHSSNINELMDLYPEPRTLNLFQSKALH